MLELVDGRYERKSVFGNPTETKITMPLKNIKVLSDGGYFEDILRTKVLANERINFDINVIRKKIEEFKTNNLSGNDIFEFDFSEFIINKDSIGIKNYLAKRSVDLDKWNNQVSQMPLIADFSNTLPSSSNYVSFMVKEMIKNSFDSIVAMYDQAYYKEVSSYGVKENQQRILNHMFLKDKRAIKLSVNIKNIDVFGECLVIEVADNGLGINSADTDFKNKFAYYKGGSGIGTSAMRNAISKAGGDYQLNLFEDGAKTQVILPLNNLVALEVEDGGLENLLELMVHADKDFLRPDTAWRPSQGIISDGKLDVDSSKVNKYIQEYIFNEKKDFNFYVPSSLLDVSQNQNRVYLNRLISNQKERFEFWSQKFFAKENVAVIGKTKGGIITSSLLSEVINEILKNSYDAVVAKYDQNYLDAFLSDNVKTESQKNKLRERVFKEIENKIGINFLLKNTSDGKFLEIVIEDNGLGILSPNTEYKKKYAMLYNGGAGIGKSLINIAVDMAGGEFKFIPTENGATSILSFRLANLGVEKDTKALEEIIIKKQVYRDSQDFIFDMSQELFDSQDRWQLKEYFLEKRNNFENYFSSLSTKANIYEILKANNYEFVNTKESVSSILRELFKNSYDSIQSLNDPLFLKEVLAKDRYKDYRDKISSRIVRKINGNIKISFGVELKEDDKEFLVIKVLDNGLGPHGPNTLYKYDAKYYLGGAGQGLAYVMQAVKDVGGSFVLTGDENGGAAIVSLPIRKISQTSLNVPDGGKLSAEEINSKFEIARQQTQEMENNLIQIRNIIDSPEVSYALKQKEVFDFIDSKLGQFGDVNNLPSGFFNFVLQIKKILSSVFETEAKWFRLEYIFLDVQSRISTQAKESEISIKVNNLETIKMHTYSSFLEAALYNVVNNAYLHAFEGNQRENKEIIIDAKSLDNVVEITVMDNGNGISEDKLKTIWEKEANERGRDYHFGLPGVKDYIENILNGTIKIESSLGQGSKFIITVPKENTNPSYQGREIIDSQIKSTEFVPSLGVKRHDIKNLTYAINAYLGLILDKVITAGVKDEELLNLIQNVKKISGGLGDSLKEDGGIGEKIIQAQEQSVILKSELIGLTQKLSKPASEDLISIYLGTASNEKANGAFNQLYRIEKSLQSEFETSISEISLNSLIKEIQKKNRNDDVNIEFKNEDSTDIRIFSRYSYLEKVLENIIYNAIKYSDSQKKDKFITISIIKKNSFVEIDIIDNGKGIEPKILQAIQNGTLKEEQPEAMVIDGVFSSKFGLSAVKEYLDHVLLGIWKIESVVGEGSSFKIILPVDYGQITSKGEKIVLSSDKENFKNIRHDVNNYLTSLLGYTELIVDDVNDLDLAEIDKKDISDSIKKIESIGTLIRDALKEENFTKEEVIRWSNQMFLGNPNIGLELPDDISQEDLNILGNDFKTAALSKMLAVEDNLENKSRLEKLVSVFGLGILGVSAISGLILPPIGAIIHWQQYFHYDFDQYDLDKLRIEQNTENIFNEVALDPMGDFNSRLDPFSPLTVYYLEPVKEDAARHAIVGDELKKEGGIPGYFNGKYVYSGAKSNLLFPFVKTDNPLMFIFSTIPEETAYELKLNLVPQDQERYVVAYFVDSLVGGNYSIGKYQENREKVWNYIAANIQYDPIVSQNLKNGANNELFMGTKMPSELLIEGSPAICVDYSRLTSTVENHLLWMTLQNQAKEKYSFVDYLKDNEIYFSMENYSHPVYAEYAAMIIQASPIVGILGTAFTTIVAPVLFTVRAAGRLLERIKNNKRYKEQVVLTQDWEEIAIEDDGGMNKVNAIKENLLSGVEDKNLISKIRNSDIKQEQIEIDGAMVDVFILDDNLMIDYGMFFTGSTNDENTNLKGMYIYDVDAILLRKFAFEQIKAGNAFYATTLYHEYTHQQYEKKYQPSSDPEAEWVRMYIDEWNAMMRSELKYTKLSGKSLGIVPLDISLRLTGKGYYGRHAMQNYQIGYLLYLYSQSHSREQMIDLMAKCMNENTFKGFLQQISNQFDWKLQKLDNFKFESLRNLLNQSPEELLKQDMEGVGSDSYDSSIEQKIHYEVLELMKQIGPEIAAARAAQYWKGKSEIEKQQELTQLSEEVKSAMKLASKQFFITINGPITEEVKNLVNAYMIFAREELNVTLQIAPDNRDPKHLNERLVVTVVPIRKNSDIIEIDDGGSGSKNKLGGVDLRRLPVKKQYSANILKELSQKDLTVTLADLDKQWSQLNTMVKSGFAPSGQRLKEYAFGCVAKGVIDSRRDDLLNCLAGILRMEEDKNNSTDICVKDTIMFLETDNVKFITKR